MLWNDEIEILLSRGYTKSVADGIRELADSTDKNKAASEKLSMLLDMFTVDGIINMNEALSLLSLFAAEHGLSKYGLHLAFIIAGLPYMHKKFREKGLSDEVFYVTMDDIRCKVNECVECKGEIGTFVAGWYDRFFKAECFGFGRFQYETAAYGDGDFELSCGKILKKGDTFINIHIPSRGIPLTDDVRFDSYRTAYGYFKPLFRDGVVIFGCHSWLLYGKHSEFLPEGMNIRKFLSDFELIYSVETEEFEDEWRIFGKYAGLPYNELPADTALRKAYAEWLCSGRRSGVGFGVFAFDGEKIIR